ncbi:MAG TPA: sigma-70 family RNA polymerase sigma factor, partial [Streptosporangiaceae bacterium]|nr:sigma-70 family RNA polymerase sigma factor [Streptosporangiaceae bacterium]
MAVVGDGEILDAIAAGDPAGLTIAYDHHAAEIYGFCRVMLGDPGDAAEALQDTFAAAGSGLRALRDAAHLRPWLFAMARAECHRRRSDRAAPGGTGAAGDALAPPGDAGGAGPLALVRAALPALTGEEREVAELSLRYELASGGLARVLGVSGRRARAAAARAQDAFGRALRAALVARTGRGSCPELAGMLTDWDGALTAPLRDQILAHAAGCGACGPRSRRELAAGVLLNMLPVLTAPAGLRDQVLRAITGESPAAVAYRARVARRSWPYDRSGFPRQPSPPPPTARRLKAPVQATAAVVAALAVVGGSTLLATGLTGQPGPGSGGPRG